MQATTIWPLGHGVRRWCLTNAAEWWREVEDTGITEPDLDNTLGAVLSLISLLCPSRFPKQPDCGLVLPDTCVRIYDADREIKRVADSVLKTEALADVLDICEVGREGAARRY